jgi:hypothetical protein
MSSIFQHQWVLPLAVLLAYAVLMGTNPVRHVFLDGMRAMRRYPRIWGIPAGLGLCYALFHTGLILFFYMVLPMEQRPAFGWQIAWVMPPSVSHLGETHSLGDWFSAFFADPHWQACRDGMLDGLESLAGLFNGVTTFPISAVAALFLIFNWHGHHATLRVALRKRFGKWALLVHAAILICAVSAVLAPVLYGPSLVYLNRSVPSLLLVRWAALIDWFSSLFAYLFGVGVQVYLILIVYTWLRGLNWTPLHLMNLAIRRFSFVVKWAGVVMAFSSLLIDLPRISALLFRFDDPLFLNHTLLYTDRVARPLLALFLIFFSTMQITLTFHSETLRKAVGQHMDFLRRHWWQLSWFLLVAALHLFAMALLNRTLLLGLGGDSTSAGLIWTLFHPIPAAFLIAWLLASWVSLFKRCQTGRVQAPDWIPF